MKFKKLKILPMLWLKNKSVAQAAFLVVLSFAIFSLSNLIDQKKIVGLSSEEINFNSQPPAKPIDLFNLKNSALLVNAEIKLNFINKDSSFSYGNLFQTTSQSDGLRLELQPNNKLVLIAGENHLFTIANNLKANLPYNVEIQYSRNKNLLINLDGKIALNIQDPEVLGLKLHLKNFVIGSGYSLSRPFNGEINSFQTNLQYSEPTFLAIISTWTLLPLAFILFALLYLKNFNIKELLKKSSSQLAQNDIYLYPLTIIFCGSLIWVAFFFGEQYIGLTKWLPYLFIPFTLFFLSLIKKNPAKPIFLEQFFITLSLVIYSGLLLYSQQIDHTFNFLFLFCALATFITVISINQYRIVTAVVSLISWTTVYSLPNWSSVSRILEDAPFPYLFFSCATIVAIGWFIYSNAKSPSINNSLIKLGLYIIPLSIFFFLSFRTDALFIPGSEYHWEYFIGPIRTIRNGGWLLFDTPSQYGFLNILLASILPIASSWQSFYIFQSSVLFITSSSILLLLFSICRDNFGSKTTIFLLVMGSFFFADPALIGPTPYPSSSVTRFFSCYLLLCLSFLPKQYPFRILFFSLGWLIGILWSAESSLYSTIIYIFYITADIFSYESWKDKKLILIRYFGYSSALLIGTLIAITAYYEINLGQTPNFLAHYDYAIGYASGFGYVPFPLNGPGNAVLLLFLGLSLLTLTSTYSTINSSMTASIACASGCIWAIGSYYLGRPVPQNITAMLPLLTTCSLIGLLQARRGQPLLPYGPLAAAAFPFLFLILSTFYIGSFWERTITIESFSKNISNKLSNQSEGLSNALKQIDPDGLIPRVFLGDGAVSPNFNIDIAERTWLPSPLQLIMPPIPDRQKELILDRFLCAHPYRKAILIHQPGSISSELPELSRIFNKHLDLILVEKIDSYEIFLYNSNSSAPCKS